MKLHKWTAIALLAIVTGCGGGGIEQMDTVPVTGTLYLDGEPHGPCNLMLYPVPADTKDKRPNLGGTVDAEGRYTLTTYEEGDGAPPGVYSVELSGATAAGSTDPAEMMAAMSAPAVEATTITIPEEGSDSLEIRLNSTEAPQSSGAGDLLGQ